MYVHHFFVWLFCKIKRGDRTAILRRLQRDATFFSPFSLPPSRSHRNILAYLCAARTSTKNCELLISGSRSETEGSERPRGIRGGREARMSWIEKLPLALLTEITLARHCGEKCFFFPSIIRRIFFFQRATVLYAAQIIVRPQTMFLHRLFSQKFPRNRESARESDVRL